MLIGVGVGLPPIGFAYLAATASEERLGQTMGAAEVGRELGDAGGPLLVGALAAAITLTPRCWFSADYSPPLPVPSPHPTAGHRIRSARIQPPDHCSLPPRHRGYPNESASPVAQWMPEIAG